VSTKGSICFIADSEAKNSYSHWDSGPDELGLKVLHWLRSEVSQPEVLRTAIRGLKVVSDDDGPPPTPEEHRRLLQYSDEGAGDPNEEWYALLNGTQGNPAAICASGYVVHEDNPFGWIYEVNADEQRFSVSYDGQNGATWPWSALPTDHQFLEDADRLDPHY
jgi:hypothetical protein